MRDVADERLRPLFDVRGLLGSAVRALKQLVRVPTPLVLEPAVRTAHDTVQLFALVHVVLLDPFHESSNVQRDSAEHERPENDVAGHCWLLSPS